MNPRISANKMRNIIEQMYVDFTCSFHERLRYAKNKKSCPYKAELQQGEIIICGHNPWLEARLVKNVQINSDKDGNEKLMWQEIDRSEIWEKIRMTKQ